MASIEKRGGKWRCRWYEAGGAHRSKTFDRKVDAEHWLLKVGHDQLTGAYVTPSAGAITFRAWAEEWQELKLHRPSTAAQVESHFRLHVYPVLGDLPLAKISPPDIQKLVNGLTKKGLAAATVEVIYNHVANVFKVAIRSRRLAATPCVDIDLPEVRASGVLEILTVDQVAALAEHMTARFRAAVVLGAGAGLRPGEILGLQVDRIDWLRRTVTVDRQLWSPSTGAPRLVEPKTVASERIVPVPQFVADELAAHIARWPAGPMVFGSRAGGMVRRSSFGDAWQRARRAADVPAWATWHGLRHFYASMLISQGHDVKTLQRRLGHKSAKTTLDTYGHLWGDHEDRTREAVDAVLGLAFRLPAAS